MNRNQDTNMTYKTILKVTWTHKIEVTRMVNNLNLETLQHCQLRDTLHYM